MILSFHPLISADQNILCAGRNPDEQDLKAIQNARVVLLPQGCKRNLYEMVRNNCDHVFPNYDMRFDFPGKLGQIALFRKYGIRHPWTECFAGLEDFFRYQDVLLKDSSQGFPFIFKFNWGGEGDMVFMIHSISELSGIIQKAESFERTGQKGFLIQEFIPSGSRSLRTVVIGNHLVSYWRVQNNPNNFKTGVASGSIIDKQADPELKKIAESVLEPFLEKTKINLAGFDFIFSERLKRIYLLEINYFFGRRGLGGSGAFYRILIKEINQWLRKLGFSYDLEIDTNQN